MKLELLANELLLDLFEFLNGIHLLRAFHGLNSRFDNLLVVHFQSNPLDFRYVSKTDFDIVCQQHLPSFVDRIVSLCLSDDDETPQQTERFLAHDLTLNQFTHLQSLSLIRVLPEMMSKIMDDLCHLSHLTRLNHIKSSLRFKYIANILRLPKLIHCTLHYIDWENYLAAPLVISFSLQNLTIMLATDFDKLKHLLKYMPCLRRLSLSFLESDFVREPSFTIPSLEILKLSLTKSTNGLENLVQHMPNLCQLTVDVLYIYVDGYQWKKIITDYLPKLKIFRLRTQFSLNKDEEQVDQIVDSFRTHFWIDEHQCFVRCHWRQRGTSKYYYLYTLPYIFTEDEKSDIIEQFKSTCPHEDDYYSYNHVQSFSYNGCSLSTDFLRIRFPNIRQLHLKLPCDNRFWCVFPTLHRLTSLSASFAHGDTTAQCQLQALLDKAPRLYSLRLQVHVPAGITSKSIRRLDLLSDYPSYDEQTCIALCSSPLGIQCEFLSINVENRTTVLYLFNNMKNLRALKFDCQDDIQEDILNVLPWLQQSLPSTCTISKVSDLFPTFNLWIR